MLVHVARDTDPLQACDQPDTRNPSHALHKFRLPEEPIARPTPAPFNAQRLGEERSNILTATITHVACAQPATVYQHAHTHKSDRRASEWRLVGECVQEVRQATARYGNNGRNPSPGRNASPGASHACMG